MTNKNPEYLSLNEFAEAIHIHPQTVRKWDKAGTLTAHYKTKCGHRSYTQQQVDEYFNRTDVPTE